MLAALLKRFFGRVRELFTPAACRAPESVEVAPSASEPPPPPREDEPPGDFPPTEFPEDPRDVTLSAARDWLRNRVEAGAHCPCCSQYAKVYARTVTSTMAYALICIYHYFAENPEASWLHVPDYLTRVCRVGPTVRGGDWAKLTAWGLLEMRELDREDGSPRNGYYRITEKGKEFVRGTIALPRYALFYDGRVLRLDDDRRITIGTALGKRFDYAELMSRAPSGL